MATALDLYAPFDDGPGANATEDTWRRIMRRLGSPGVLRNVADEARVFGDSTGLQVKVDPLEAWIEGHWGLSSSTITLPVNTAHGSLTRLDLVVVRADYGANRIELEVLAGTPSSNPAPPSPVRNSAVFDVPIGIVTVAPAAVTISASDVLSLRTSVGGNPVPPEADDFLLYGDRISNLRRRDINSITNIQYSSGTTRACRMVPTRAQRVTKVRYALTTRQVGGNAGQGGIYRGWDQSRMYLHQTFNFDFFSPPITETFIKEVTLTLPMDIMAGENIIIAGYVSGSPSQTPVLAGIAFPSADLSNVINPDTSASYIAMTRSGNFTNSTSIDFQPSAGWTKAWFQPWLCLA